MVRLKKRLQLAEQGFSLFEVLIAILVTTIFISIAMQAMVFAAVFKVKAQEYAEATTWIQEDLENVKYQADNLQFPQTTLAVTVAVGVSPITGSAATSFPSSGKLQVGLDTTSYAFTRVANVLTLTPPLVLAQASEAAIIDITMCTASTKPDGLADSLRDKVTGSNQTSDSNYVDKALNSKFTNKSYLLRRTTTIANTSPYNVLQIKYEVSPGATFDSSKLIATFDTEVIPNVTFKCP
ncbi:hypothetical protein C7B80_14565 [Cyanosarcina cf. burmensis CCALA 770]|nr:hypothetical protein C7B80_14565 [Cyanosarcina cf. burmensis CCALA 770]